MFLNVRKEFWEVLFVVDKSIMPKDIYLVKKSFSLVYFFLDLAPPKVIMVF